VGDVGAAVGLGNAHVGHQECHRLGGHRSAPICVDRQLTGGDVLFLRGLGDEALRAEPA
jgi:hypothetical protein